MEEFFTNFLIYFRKSDFSSFEFWLYPLGTLFLIWLLTVIGLKVFNKRKYLKTVFLIHKAWIIASLVVSTLIIGIASYWWTINYFSEKPIQIALLLSLLIALLIPIITFISLRNYFSKDGLKEIISQPKTQNQLNDSVILLKQYFKKIKLYYLILLGGFLMLLLVLNKGQNLITIVFDNSSSMENSKSVEALSDTFDQLEINNEIVLTTLEGYGENAKVEVPTMKEILAIKDYSKLTGGKVVSYANPESAKSGLSSISGSLVYGSPICESVWKSFLFIKATKSSIVYKNKVLIIVTDGVDNIESTIPSNEFFFDNAEFDEYFPSNNVFIIDFSETSNNPFLNKFTEAGADIYSVENQKEQYLSALNNALGSFSNNWYFVMWMALITIIMVVIALLIEPKKIT